MPDDHRDHPDVIREFHQTRRHLPHWQSPGATHFLTFRLKKRELCTLTDPRLAPIIISALWHWDGAKHELGEYTVMPDHVHVLLRPLHTGQGWVALSKIAGGLKGWTANQMNALLHRRGAFWQDGTFDHIVRGTKDYRQIASYILMNPVRAELVEDAMQWPWWGRGRSCRGMDGVTT